MQKAFLEDHENCFIREMQILREPAIVLAQDRQLNDLVNFCTNDAKFGIMTVDPTFSLGEFDVTVTTYQHLLLQCRRTSNHPVFIGPVMVHYRKSFSTYLFFFSTLLGIRPEITHLKCFGTDGEEALYGAIEHVFPKAIHLLCSLHVKRNIKAKLHELKVGEDTHQVVIGDIFGKQITTQQVEGLIDSETEEEFERGLMALTKKWESMDSNDRGPLHAFGRWFYQHKRALMKEKMLKPTRSKAGLGDQPSQFTTNASESMNAVLKSKVDYKKSELPAFLEQLKSVIDEQERELERAIVNRGKYRLCDDYKKLEIKEDHWFLTMSRTQRAAHIKRVLSYKVGSKVPAPCLSATSKKIAEADFSKPSCSRHLFSEPQSSKGQRKILSVDVGHFSDLVLIQSSVLDAIWTKARELLNDEKSICMVPGGNSKDRIVKSSSGRRPHIVTAKKTGQYACDSECPNWKSLGVCSHSVAAAEDNNDLNAFVDWLKRTKKAPNLTKLVTAKMPKGRGRKGCVPPRKRRKKVAMHSRKSFAQVLKEQASTEELSEGEKESYTDNMDSSSEDVDSTQHHSTSKTPKRGQKGRGPTKRKVDVHSHKSSSEVLKKQASTEELSEFEDGHIDGKDSSSEDADLAQHLSPSGGGTLNINDSHICGGDVQLSAPSYVGVGKHTQNQHAGSVVLTHSSHGTNTKLTVTGGTQQSSHLNKLPHLPPPLVHCPSSLPPQSSSSFELAFIRGNISVCRGCRQKYAKPAVPPMDLCIRHKEWQTFVDQCGGQQSRYGNVYYHCNVPCIQSRCPEFEPELLEIDMTIAMQLLPVHTNYLIKQMPGRFK